MILNIINNNNNKSRYYNIAKVSNDIQF
jgi:hypothetical protein